MLYVAEVVYSKVYEIKKNNKKITNIDAIRKFLGTETFNEISCGRFHDIWFKELENNKFIDNKTGKEIPEETMNLLKIQKDMMVKQLMKIPDLYYTKSFYPLEISHRAFDHLWRVCESYELWCKEVGKKNLITLKILD